MARTKENATPERGRLLLLREVAGSGVGLGDEGIGEGSGVGLGDEGIGEGIRIWHWYQSNCVSDPVTVRGPVPTWVYPLGQPELVKDPCPLEISTSVSTSLFVK